MIKQGDYIDLKTLDVNRGYIYLCNLGNGKDSVQGGVRPVLVIKNKKGIDNGSVLTVVPITSKINKGKNLPTHISIGMECGLTMDSELQVEQATTISKSQLLFENNFTKELELREIGQVSEIILRKVDIAYRRDNGFMDLYFNKDEAFKLCNLIANIERMKLPALIENKRFLYNRLQEYCDAYNKDCKQVIIDYNNEMRAIDRVRKEEQTITC